MQYITQPSSENRPRFAAALRMATTSRVGCRIIGLEHPVVTFSNDLSIQHHHCVK